MTYEERDYMDADAAFDRAESLRWKREMADEPDPTFTDNGDGTAGWPR